MLQVPTQLDGLGKPVMTAERFANGYRPEFDIDLARGVQAERYVQDIRDAFTTQRVEVKRDDRAFETGNLYIEYECRHRDGVWRPSGIAASTALVWAFVIGRLVIAAPTLEVRELAREQYRVHPERRKLMDVGSNPTRGMVIPTREYVQHLSGRVFLPSSTNLLVTGGATT